MITLPFLVLEFISASSSRSPASTLAAAGAAVFPLK